MLAKQALIPLINEFSMTTARLHIRKMAMQDLAVNIAHEQNPEIMRYIRDIQTPEQTEAKSREFLQDWQGEENTWFAFAVEQKSGSQVMGMVCLKLESYEYGRFEIGYRLHPDFQNQGFMIEAVKCVVDFLWQQVGVHKISAYCVAEHQKSYGLMEKIGMKREACLRQHSTLAGRWHDELIYGMLQEDYLATQPS